MLFLCVFYKELRKQYFTKANICSNMSHMGYVSMKESYGKPVEVICQHAIDGTIIPMRIRLVDDDGMVQTLSIKGYRDLSHQAGYKLPNGFEITVNDHAYECKLEVFGMKKTIVLFYRPQSDTAWRIAT